MPGQVRGLAAADRAGPVFVTSFDGRGTSSTALAAVDLAGTVIWRSEFDGRPVPPRIGADGGLWIAPRGPDGCRLAQLAADSSTVHSLVPEQEAGEHLGAFVVLPDGFCVAWIPAAYGHPPMPGRPARLARYDGSGRTMWSTPLGLEEVSFPGVVEARADNDWRVAPMRPWQPDYLKFSYDQPLLVSGDRVLVNLVDGGSGIGVCTVVDVMTGRVVVATDPAPDGAKAIPAPGCFLVGSQGYGEFSSTVYDRAGRPVRTWPSHGMVLVDRYGTIRGPELENVLPSPSRFRIFDSDGALRDGPRLSGYHTTYPALDGDGTAVFWRDGKLLAVDADLRMRELFGRDVERTAMSRVLLLDCGQLVFALGDELLVFRNTGLAALDTGPWPCGDGNIHGNPVIVPE
jgi:hypothetical protein